MTPGPWYYVTGAVWTTPGGPDDGGQCIAMRASESEIQPTDRDDNLRACAAVPTFIGALECALVALTTTRNGSSPYCAEAIAVARAALRKVGQ